MGTLAMFFLAQEEYQKVTSFQECEDRGFAIMESHPRQCQANGVTFVEELKETPIEEETPIVETPVTPEPIVVTEPLPDALIKSPLVIRGEAVGNWYFEASFPIRLLDGNGEELVVKPAQAQGEWMTTNYVPFEVSLEFETPDTDTGILVLEKDNPSGLPEHDASMKIPVRFK